jgi:CheY-like chemotaxis protein
MLMQSFYPSETPKRRKSVVLIVEDERVSRRALAALLDASGYETEAVGSGEEAMKILKRGHVPNIALVDLDLPGMNGLEVIRRLEQIDPDVFPVLITAAERDNLEARLHENGVAYMRKPLDFDQLLSIISEKQLPH